MFTGFRQRASVTTNGIFMQKKNDSVSVDEAKKKKNIIETVEYNANTSTFFWYLSYLEIKSFIVQLNSNISKAAINADPKLKLIEMTSLECLSYLQKAYESLMLEIENDDEYQRISAILESSNKIVSPLFFKHKQFILDKYVGKFYSDYENNIAWASSFITHIRRLLVMSIKIQDDMVSKWSSLYPLAKDKIMFKETAMAYDKINHCYIAAMAGVNIDLTKFSDNKRIQADIINTITDKRFYNKCCQMANTHL